MSGKHKCRMCPETDPKKFSIQRKNGREYLYFVCNKCRSKYLAKYKERKKNGMDSTFDREVYTMLEDPTGDFRPGRNRIEIGVVQMTSDLRFFVYEDGTRFAKGNEEYIVKFGELVRK